MYTKNQLLWVLPVLILIIALGCNEDNGLNTLQAPTTSDRQLIINDSYVTDPIASTKSNFDIDQPAPGEDYNFYLSHPANNAWAQLGTTFSWTKMTMPPGRSLFRYDVHLRKDGTTYHRYATPYYSTYSTSTSISGIPQGTYAWEVLADYTQSGGNWSFIDRTVKLYDVNIKGPSSAVPLNNQVWYVDEHSNFGPYSYQWKVYNNNGQTVCGPFSTSTLSASQIPSVAYGVYWIDLYVTFDAGTKHKTKQVIMD